MASFSNIKRPTTSNKGGMVRLLLADVNDVENETLRVVRGSGYVNDPIVLKDAKPWLEVSFTPQTLRFKETTNRKGGSSIFPASLSWRQAKDEAWKIDQLQRMERKRWIGLVQNRNDEWLIIGTPEEPAAFMWKSRYSGEKATDYSGFDLELVVTRREPVPFYKVYAVFYWNSSGQLIFDNTFDPTLNASVDASGNLTISGPNEALYTESNGILLYNG